MEPDPKWKKSIDDGFASPLRHIWNGFVSMHVEDYNARLASTQGYVRVDPRFVVAMLWVESLGPEGHEWLGRVMQIGNADDKGLLGLKSHESATDLIVPKDLLDYIDKASTKDIGAAPINIPVGIAYLFERMAKSEYGTILDPKDEALYQHEVQQGETAETIAKAEGTTLDEIRASSPDIRNIAHVHAGQVLHFHKARWGRRITGWYSFDPTTIAARYNHHDPAYAAKLRYVLDKLDRDAK